MMLLVEVEVDPAQLARVNEGRRKLNQQPWTLFAYCENVIVSQLQGQVVPVVRVHGRAKTSLKPIESETIHTED